MTSETPTDRVVPPLTLIENPQAAEAAHQAVPRGFRRGQEFRRQARLPLQEGGFVDAPQDREQEARPQAQRVEAERGVEVDDAWPAVLGDQDVVALAEIDVSDPPRVDLAHEALKPLEHRTDIIPFPPAPAGDPLPL